MKDIKYCSTKDLVDELKSREGVEMILVDVMDRCEVFVDNDFDVCVYDTKTARSGDNSANHGLNHKAYIL